MVKALFDTNIILDIALGRPAYLNQALTLFSFIDKKILKGYVTASTITDIYYISKREKGHNTAIEFISNLINILDVVGIDRETLLYAIHSDMKDFEDAVQVAAADFNGIDCLLTRNKKDFTSATILVYTPQEFIEKHSKGLV